MGNLTASGYLHATVIADLIHWGTIGVVALCGWLVSRWWQQRHPRIRAVPTSASVHERCVCATCGNPHPRMLTREQMRAFIDDTNKTLGPLTLSEATIEQLSNRSKPDTVTEDILDIFGVGRKIKTPKAPPENV